LKAACRNQAGVGPADELDLSDEFRLGPIHGRNGFRRGRSCLTLASLSCTDAADIGEMLAAMDAN
jgi:hypothetical protein